MTKTTTPTAPTAGELLHVDPGTLLLERNIREAKTDKDLVASIRVLGVVQPLTAVRNTDGGLVVRTGHRRTLAAIEVGLATVPVYVLGVDSLEQADEIVRMVTQRDENTHRSALSASDEVGFVGQMAAFGLPAAQIAKIARIHKDDVDVAITVGGSTLALKAADKYEALTLDQAAVVARYEDDTEFAKKLIVTAVENPGNFAHIVERRRQDDRETKLRQLVIDDLKTRGIKFLKERPYYSTDKAARLANLKDVKSDTAHTTCPGHSAYLGWKRGHVDSNDDVVPDRLDNESDEERNARLGRYHETNLPAAEYACADWRKHGHTHSHGAPSKPKADDMSAAERETARKARNLVIENNKAWDAAEPVRREFVANLAKTKTPPKATAAFIATAMFADSAHLNESTGRQHAQQWAGMKGGHDRAVPAELSGAKLTDNRALVVALVYVLGSYEGALTRDSWRGNGTTNPTGRYLRFLESAGYGLSDVEKFAITSKTA